MPSGTLDYVNIVIRHEANDIKEELCFLNQEIVKGLNALLLILTGSSIITLLSVFLIGDGDERILLVTLAIIMALQVLGYLLPWDVFFLFKGKAKKKAGGFTFNISEEGLLARREGNVKQIAWHEILNVIETEQCFSVLTLTKKPYVLPKRCFRYFRDIILLRKILQRKVDISKLSLLDLKLGNELFLAEAEEKNS